MGAWVKDRRTLGVSVRAISCKAFHVDLSSLAVANVFIGLRVSLPYLAPDHCLLLEWWQAIERMG